jgi:hypothetical protein
LEEIVAQLENTMPNRSIIIFFDQFEDFFLLLTATNRQQFIKMIGKIFAKETNARAGLRLVFALREDLLAEMSQFKPAIPEVFHHEYRLRRLSREQAGRAITEPAKAVGCQYEAALVTRLLDDLSEADGVDPPQLQIACDQLCDARNADGKLTVAVYERPRHGVADSCDIWNGFCAGSMRLIWYRQRNS